MIDINSTHIVPKNWGHENVICNNSKYCGKILVIEKNKFCSLHFHKLKEEDFFVLEGTIQLTIQKIENDVRIGEIETTILKQGDVVNLKPYTLHRFCGIDDINKLIEFSTQHFEDDSYRLEPSCEK